MGLFEPRSWIFWTLICSTGQNPSLTYLIIDSYIDFSTTFLLLLCSTWVFARRVKLGGRGITRKERRRERIMVSPLFRVMMLTFVQGLSVSRRCERASERASRARPRMREICFFLWEGQPKDPEGPTDFQYASWCVFSWQRRWLGVCVPIARDLCSLKCGTSRMGTTRKWQTCWCKNSVDYNSALEQSFLWIQG